LTEGFVAAIREILPIIQLQGFCVVMTYTPPVEAWFDNVELEVIELLAKK
jgi:hypothetical protein